MDIRYRITITIVAVVLLGIVHSEQEAQETKQSTENDISHGFGDDIEWVRWDEALEQSKTLNKPVFLLIHKSWCGACQALKTIFRTSAKRNDFVELSKQFVMVNTEDDEEPEDERYSPDGQYIPRIFFLDENGDPFKHVNNRASYPRNAHYFPQLPNIIQAMERAIRAYNTAKRGETEEEKGEEKESTTEQKVTDNDVKETEDELSGCPHAAKIRAMKKEQEAKEKAAKDAKSKTTETGDAEEQRNTSAENDSEASDEEQEQDSHEEDDRREDDQKEAHEHKQETGVEEQQEEEEEAGEEQEDEEDEKKSVKSQKTEL